MLVEGYKKPQPCSDWDFESDAFCRAYGNRTRDSSVKGRCLNPLTNAPFLGAQR